MGLVLGIESSCDETAVALVDGEGQLVAQKIASQIAQHAEYGGVVPEIAARAHSQNLAPMIADILQENSVALAELDAIAATAGPGLIGGVMVGLVSAKALALAGGVPLIAINHLEGHALSPRLADKSLQFPYLLLLVSGGHCQILLVQSVGEYRRLSTTIDDALGEAFDKSAKILGLGYPGGPALEKMALSGIANAVPLPRPLSGSKDPNFSFAGLKSAVLRAKQSGQYRDQDIAASFQKAALDCLIDRLTLALSHPSITGTEQPIGDLVVAGGVAANHYLREGLGHFAATNDLRFSAPPMALCTDNAAMIAWAGVERMTHGLVIEGGDPLNIAASARWPLDPHAEKVRGAGAKA